MDPSVTYDFQDEGRIAPEEYQMSVSEFARQDEEQAMMEEQPMISAAGRRLATPPMTDEAALRKGRPIASGVLDYFPDALLEVAEVSRIGNEQHNPGQPLHWDKSKSKDEADALLRHLLDRGKRDTDGTRHSAKVAWRALALLQRELDAELEEEQEEPQYERGNAIGYIVEVQLPADEHPDGFVWMQQGGQRVTLIHALAVVQALREDGYGDRVMRVKRISQRFQVFPDERWPSEEGTMTEVVRTVWPGDARISQNLGASEGSRG